MRAFADKHTNFITKTSMEILKIEKYPSYYDINRYKWLKRTAQKLSGNYRTVEMINELLEIILSVSDAISVKNEE